MAEAGIPLHSITARCMFEPTSNSRGDNICCFGGTPLWNGLHKVNGQVLRSEFIDWVDRLVASGVRRQKAARKT
jgi:hypothetical protein